PHHEAAAGHRRRAAGRYDLTARLPQGQVQHFGAGGEPHPPGPFRWDERTTESQRTQREEGTEKGSGDGKKTKTFSINLLCLSLCLLPSVFSVTLWFVQSFTRSSVARTFCFCSADSGAIGDRLGPTCTPSRFMAALMPPGAVPAIDSRTGLNRSCAARAAAWSPRRNAS